MANTYTQIYLHVVFAVSGRACVISSERLEELQKYITGGHYAKRAETDCDLLHARSHAYSARPETQHRSLRFGRRDQNRIDQSYQREEVDRMQIFVAGRIRRVFCFAFASGRVVTTFAIKRCIIAENRFNKNMLSFWSGITFPSISVIFSSQ